MAALENLSAIPEITLASTPQIGATRLGVHGLNNSSGTSTGSRGTHALPDVEVYNLASKTWFEHLLPRCPVQNTVSLVSNPQDHPESSLGHMIHHFSPKATWCFNNQKGVIQNDAWTALQTSEPVFLPATAFALADLLEAQNHVHLPKGSVVMITGGFKGRRRRVEMQELHQLIRQFLGTDVQIVGEYGMTELSSQLWDLGDGYQAPPWLHVYTVDPATGEPTDGAGLIRFIDIANWGSCMSIETMDMGVINGGRLTLLGRAPQAPLRGCSLSAEISQ